MNHTSLGTVLLAVLVVLAGCSGAPGGATVGDDATDGPAGSAADAGTVSFYVSDRPNAIEDFEHLNVTITKVGLHRAGDAAESTATATATETDAAMSTGNETDAQAETTDVDTTAGANATEIADGTETESGETEVGSEETDNGEPGTESDETDGEDKDGEDEGDGGWVEYETNRTVDLTRLVGDNATKLGVLEAPAGTYDKAFVYVSEINATLKNGESVDVKLPSQKLKLNKGFAVESGANVSFVFDIAVHEAGKSGKYVLKPVVSQSGTDVPVDDVEEDEEDEEDEDEDDETEGREETDEDDETEAAETEAGESDNETETTDGGENQAAEIEAKFVGRVAPGDDATVKVTGPDGPVANATVEVNGEVVGTTDASGTVTVAVSEGAESLEVTVTKGDAELELEVEFDDEGRSLAAGLA